VSPDTTSTTLPTNVSLSLVWPVFCAHMYGTHTHTHTRTEHKRQCDALLHPFSPTCVQSHCVGTTASYTHTRLRGTHMLHLLEELLGTPATISPHAALAVNQSVVR
jgi:hypothetical protein